MAYSLDLRQRVIDYIHSGGSKISASHLFAVGEKTVRNWVLLYKETGSINPRPHRGGKRSSIDSEKFKSYVDANPDKTLKVVEHTLDYRMREQHITYENMDMCIKKRCCTGKEMSCIVLRI